MAEYIPAMKNLPIPFIYVPLAMVLINNTP